jgi:hypothetical protein
MDLFNADLVDDLARQRVVLFLGSGVSSSSPTRAGGRIKGWAEFLRDLCAKVDGPTSQQVVGLIGKNDLLLACEILQESLKEEWDNFISDEFGQMAEPSALHEAILGLDQRIILTTNFDKLIETCWETKIGTSSHLPRVIASIDASVFNVLKDNKNKYLIKIHGNVDDPSTIVFSKSEYIRLAFGSAIYSSFLESLLLNYTFLFVGFSMEDPAISSLLEMYALKYPKSRPHYMFSEQGVADNVLSINRRLRKLIVIKYDSSENHKMLPKVIQNLSDVAMSRRKEIFTSYLSVGRQ